MNSPETAVGNGLHTQLWLKNYCKSSSLKVKERKKTLTLSHTGTELSYRNKKTKDEVKTQSVLLNNGTGSYTGSRNLMEWAIKHVL